MWVFIRPQGGKDYYLLMYENRVGRAFCPIHRFDGTDQFPAPRAKAVPIKSEWDRNVEDASRGTSREGMAGIFPKDQRCGENDGRRGSFDRIMPNPAARGLAIRKSGIFGDNFAHLFADGGASRGRHR